VTRTGLQLIVAVAICGGAAAAAADEPPPSDEAAEPERAPGTTTLGAPAPAEAPAPLLAPPPRAEPAAPPREPDETKVLPADPRFGDPGQIALNGALSASFGHLGYDTTDNSNTSVSVEPAFDYFSTRNFSEGVTAFVRYSSSEFREGSTGSATTVGATARLGQNVWLGDRVSLWPKLSVGVWHVWYSYSSVAGGTVTIDGLTIPISSSTHLSESVLFAELQAPVLFHLASHFYFGFGPDVFVDLVHSVESAKNLRRFVGASSTLGGWF